MAKIDESQLGDDFSYIIRIADSDIDGLKQVKQGLTSIRGIGNAVRNRSVKLLELTRECSQGISATMTRTNSDLP